MRNIKYDFLRSIGLILVVLAHVHAPNTIVQIRCFDVPLMVFVSGLVTRMETGNMSAFFFKRITRLLIPVYLFISVLFLTYYIFSLLGFIQVMENFGDVMIQTYTLSTTKGLGYVWIFRVFLLMMLITPLISKINIAKTKSYIIMLLLLLLLLMVNTLFCNTEICKESPFFTELFRDILQYIWGYGLIYLIAIRLRQSRLNERGIHLFIILILSIISFLVYSQTHGYPITISNEYKYPPHWYFIIYGLVCSTAFFTFLDNIPKIITTNKFLIFLGQNTMWIYLWHIPFISVSEVVCHNWLESWIFVLIFAISIYGVQYILVNRYLKDCLIHKYLVG